MSNWQPMETAPKDGTRILLAYEVYRGPRVMEVKWEHTLWKGTVYVGPSEGCLGWMPLPPAPTPEPRVTLEGAIACTECGSEFYPLDTGATACCTKCSTTPEPRHTVERIKGLRDANGWGITVVGPNHPLGDAPGFCTICGASSGDTLGGNCDVSPPCPGTFRAPEPECGECGQGSGAKGWVYGPSGINQGPCPSCSPTPKDTKED